MHMEELPAWERGKGTETAEGRFIGTDNFEKTTCDEEARPSLWNIHGTRMKEFYLHLSGQAMSQSY